MRLQPIIDIAEICSRKGIEEAIVCPGSRCAPLTLSFVRHPKIKTRTISDERSAGFIALGIAQQTGKPVVLICTSGTAVYNFAAAIAEAFYQQIPLMVMSADRPREWIGQWDGQTIQQKDIFGKHVKAFYQFPQEYDGDASWQIHRMANEAINKSNLHPPGPVHLNIPLKEPLYPEKTATITYSKSIQIVEPVRSPSSLNQEITQSLSTSLSTFKKILVVAGQARADLTVSTALEKFCRATGACLAAEIISNLHSVEGAVQFADSVVGAAPERLKEALQPELLVTFGKSIVSKNLKLFLRKYKPREHWHISEDDGNIIDPFQSVTKLIAASPGIFFSSVGADSRSENEEYRKAWATENIRIKKTTAKFFKEAPMGELSFVAKLLSAVPDQSALHLANSMSVRYANLAGLTPEKGKVEVFSNRGTSGIDGCSSTAVGHAMASGKLNILITGDMAFFYDRNAFWNNYPLRNLRIAVLNNHGGVIFGMIDGPGELAESEEYFVTRQALSARRVADEFGFDYQRVTADGSAEEAIASFLQPGEKTKILEFESDSQSAKDLFLKFKEQIGKAYET